MIITKSRPFSFRIFIFTSGTCAGADDREFFAVAVGVGVEVHVLVAVLVAVGVMVIVGVSVAVGVAFRIVSVNGVLSTEFWSLTKMSS